MLIAHRNGMMVGKGLPYDAEVEYLESTGTQWIDTGFDPSSKQVKITLDFQIVNTGYNQFNWCTGFQATAPMVGAYADTSSDVFYNARYTYSQNADKYAKTKAVYNGIHPDTNGAGTLLIFARRALNGSVPNPGGSKRIFGLSIIYSGILVMDMIPVRVRTVGYMYDRVSGQLFGNQGTGAFTYGHDKASSAGGGG